VLRQSRRILVASSAIATVAAFAVLLAADLHHHRPIEHNAGAAQQNESQNFVDLARLPIAFSSSAGVVNRPASFVTHTAGLALRLMPGESAISLRRVARESSSASSPRRSPPSADLKIRFLGANQSSQLTGIDRLPGVVNYYFGKNPKDWRSRIATFARVENRSLQPGIDLVYHGNGGQLEYDLNGAANADVRRVQIEFSGADKIEIEKGGDVAIRLGRQFVLLEGSGRLSADRRRTAASRRAVCDAQRAAAV
jgi:hypothetical protein